MEPTRRTHRASTVATTQDIDTSRRSFSASVLGAAGLAGLGTGSLLAPGRARAQKSGFPNRPISLVVPFPPGNATDISMRALAQAASEKLGQSVVIENRPGAAGTLGPAAVAHSAAPDGYSLAIGPATLFRLPHQQKVNFDPMKDFTYIAVLAAYTFALVINADRPWKSVADLVQHAKAHPDQVNLGGTGAGGTGNINCFMFSKLSGARFNFVPFKGGADMATAMLGGHIDGQTDAGWSPLVDSGKGRILATFTAQRLARRPDVPTMREAGYDIVSDSPWGLVGPRGMDPEIIKTLETAFLEARKSPGFQRAMEQFDLTDQAMGSAEFTKTAQRIFESERTNLEALGFTKAG